MTIKEYCEKYDQKFQTVYKKIAHHKNSELECHVIRSKGKSMEIDDFAVDFLLPTQVKVIQAIEECEGIVRENNDLKDKLYSAETIVEQTDKQLSKTLADNEKLTAENTELRVKIEERESIIHDKYSRIAELTEQLEAERSISEQKICELEKYLSEMVDENKLLMERLEAVPKIFRKS
jgi:regulator of replication initiation timing